MDKKLYWKNRFPFLFVNVLCMLALTLFLLVSGSSLDSIQVFFQILRMAEKSMLERIGAIQRERMEYKFSYCEAASNFRRKNF